MRHNRETFASAAACCPLVVLLAARRACEDRSAKSQREFCAERKFACSKQANHPLKEPTTRDAAELAEFRPRRSITAIVRALGSQVGERRAHAAATAAAARAVSV